MLNNKIPRKSFLTSLSLVTGATLLPSLLRGGIRMPDNQELIKCGPYLQSPRQNQVTIRWITNKPVYSWIKFGESPTQLDQIQHQSTDGLANANTTIQAITIDGLKPGKIYYYQILSKEIIDFKPYKVTYGNTYTSEILTFKTLKAAGDDAEIWILNDIHDRPESFQQILQFHHPDADFIFLNGDMFNWQKRRTTIS